MIDPNYPRHICKLQRALYDFKQVSRVWFDHSSTFLLQLGFFCSFVDPSLFVLHSPIATLILILYVDDVLLTSSNLQLLSTLISKSSSEFAIKDLGLTHNFLGIEVNSLSLCDGLHLLESHYLLTNLSRVDHIFCIAFQRGYKLRYWRVLDLY